MITCVHTTFFQSPDLTYPFHSTATQAFTVVLASLTKPIRIGKAIRTVSGLFPHSRLRWTSSLPIASVSHSSGTQKRWDIITNKNILRPHLQCSVALATHNRLSKRPSHALAPIPRWIRLRSLVQQVQDRQSDQRTLKNSYEWWNSSRR